MIVHQGILEDVLRKIFPNQIIFNNTKRLSNIPSSKPGYYLELDFWIPQLKLAFEFQDAYHYATSWYSQQPLDTIQTKDDAKRIALEERGETLFVIPCWWDGDIDRLKASIAVKRPDLVPGFSLYDSIPSHPPKDFFKKSHIPYLGELMAPSFEYSSSFSPDSWWLSEKYDGVRACWNLITQTLYTRRGGEINILDSFMFNLSQLTSSLDGEIWFGRGNYQETCQVPLKLQPIDKNTNWHNLRFVVFDSLATDSGINYESRFHSLLHSVSEDHDFLIPATQFNCNTKPSLSNILHNIFGNGGEGLVARKMKTLLYTPGRTDSMIKLKASRNDREALVLNLAENSSVLLKLPEGIIFEAHNPEIHKLRIGDIVTFSFSGYSNTGRPSDVEITKLRTDVTWHDVVLDSINSVTAQPVTEITSKVISEKVESDKYPYGYWTMDSGINTKIFFEKFAEKHNFSPLVADDWYSFADKVFLEEDSASVLHQYNNSVVLALQDVYDIPFDSSRFSPLARKYWHKENRRRQFDNFANQKRIEGQFDPQTSWYSLEKNILVDKNLGPIVKFCYGGSVAKAVIDLYPELQLDYFQFDNTSIRNAWNNSSYSKQFFYCLAEKLNFDPLLPHNWYSIPLSTVREEKGGESLLYFFEGSLVKALSFSYPDIQFHEHHFDHFSKSFLESKENRKRVLDSFALLHSFDPHKSDNWNYYLENFSSPASRSVINYYNGNVVAALADIYHFSNYHPLQKPKKILYRYPTNEISHNEHYVTELIKKYPNLSAKK